MKAETRNPKSEGSPKSEAQICGMGQDRGMAQEILDCGGRAQRRHRFLCADTRPKAAWRFASRRSPNGLVPAPVKQGRTKAIRISAFGFLSDFGFRSSGFIPLLALVLHLGPAPVSLAAGSALESNFHFTNTTDKSLALFEGAPGLCSSTTMALFHSPPARLPTAPAAPTCIRFTASMAKC